MDIAYWSSGDPIAELADRLPPVQTKAAHTSKKRADPTSLTATPMLRLDPDRFNKSGEASRMEQVPVP